MPEQVPEEIVEFDRSRNQLAGVTAQKQQLQFQAASLAKAVEELGKTKEKKVYKAAGNILVLCDADKTLKELEEQKETVELRVKSLQKQEDSLIKKLNSLKAKIESKAAGSPGGDATVISEAEPAKEKNSKNSKK